MLLAKVPRPLRSRWIVAPGFMLAGLLAALFLEEWWVIGVVADPAVIESYHFGSEAMVGHGGWKYATAELYAITALAEGMVAIVVMMTFAIAAITRSFAVAVGAYAALALGIAANSVPFLLMLFGY